MAVYTPLSPTQIRQLLTQYNTGSFISYAGIAEGIQSLISATYKHDLLQE